MSWRAGRNYREARSYETGTDVRQSTWFLRPIARLFENILKSDKCRDCHWISSAINARRDGLRPNGSKWKNRASSIFLRFASASHGGGQ